MNEQAIKMLSGYIHDTKRRLEYEKEQYDSIINSMREAVLNMYLIETKLASLQESLKLLKNA